MNCKFAALSFVVIPIFYCQTVTAGQYYQGKIDTVSIRDEAFGNLMYVHLAGAPQVASSCAGVPQWMVIGEVAESKYMIVYAALQNAMTKQLTVKIWGKGTCARRPGAHEDLEGVEILPQ